MKKVWLRVLLVIAAVAVMVVALRGRVPDPRTVVSVLGAADARWLAAAVLAQFLSQVAFARQQRTLLAALAVTVSRRDALAITYSRSAMSMVLPAGSAMSAAFAIKQYRRYGASRAVAATGVVLSGVASVAGLILLYGGSLAIGIAHDHPGFTAGVLALAGLAGLAGRLWLRGGASRLRWRPRSSPGKPGRIQDILRQVRAVRVRDWAATLGFAMLNWLLDLACLVAVAHACGLSLSFSQLATVYLAVQVVRQIPITPGGVGLIEASLLTGLVAAGTAESTAAAVVLGYRIVSFWLLLPVGLAAYLRLARKARRAVSALPTPAEA